MRQNPAQRPAARGSATPFARAALVPPFSPAASQEQLVVRHAARDGTGEVVLPRHQEFRVLVVVDKGKFDEDGGHVGRTQHNQLGTLLEPPVRRAETVDNLTLDARGELLRLSTIAVDQCLRAVRSAVGSVAVDAHKDVGRPLIGAVTHGAVLPIGVDALPVEIVALQHTHFAACIFEMLLDEIADDSGNFALAQSRVWIDGAAVMDKVVPWVQKYFHAYHPFIADGTAKEMPPSA